MGLLVCASILLSSSSVEAISANTIKLGNDPFDYVGVVSIPEKKITEVKDTPEPKEQKPAELPEPPAPIQYTVNPGDSLVKIGELHQIEWTRIYDKNTSITNPDSINPGQILVIPTPEEQLEKRALPTPVLSAQTSSQTSPVRTVSRISQPRGSVAGNTYAPGYCTWYAKNRRPDLPNRMGNASAWISSAAAQGFATGSTPQVGAIGQQGNHVVYVESVHGNGTITVSEMNWSGLYVVSTRTVAASNFRYIY